MQTLEWFKQREGMDVIRIYNNLETRVTICGDRSDKYIEYFFNLQKEGYTFKDTNENIALNNN